MSFNTTNATNYVKNHSDEIILSGIISNASTAKLLVDNGSVMFGVKGETAILKLSTESRLQDGSGCGRNPLGDVSLSDAKIKANPIKDQQNLCPKALYNKYVAFQALSKGAYTGEELDEKFAQHISDLRAKVIAGEIEKIIWKGDTALTGNLSRFNGILKQKGGTATTTVGADLLLKLQNVVNQTNIDLRSNDDFAVFVGVDVYETYKMLIANKNFYHNDGTVAENIFGTTTKIIPTPGLNGTDKVVATRISNLVLAMDGEGDADKVIFEYLSSENVYKQDFEFSVGVGVAYMDELSIYDVA